MKIACIGWGSLIWNPGRLKTKGDWKTDGPKLPIEFARQSDSGKITLVICEGVSLVQTLWINMDTDNLGEAIESLRKREGTATKYIHSQIANEYAEPELKRAIKKWIIKNSFDAAIWTGLPPKYNDKNGIKPSLDQIKSYVSNLSPEKFEAAKEYVLNTPSQVQTDLRHLIEEHLETIESK